jgi:hypothetical protein
MGPVSDWSMIAWERRAAATMGTLRMRCLSRGIVSGPIERVHKPRPTSGAAQGGSSISPRPTRRLRLPMTSSIRHIVSPKGGARAGPAL